MSNESENVMEERMERRSCSDCGCKMSRVTKRGRPNKIGLKTKGVNMHYMLKTTLWFEINQSYRGLLCLTCAQIRLGRKFVPTDFKPVPINFAKGGALATLFPDEFTAHMVEFVGEETEEERRKGRLLVEAYYKNLRTLETPHVFNDEVSEQDKILESETTPKTKPKTKPKKKTNTSKSTKKAMSALKKNKKAYTGAIYGWDVRKGTLVPNWKEQNNMEWMKIQLKYDVPAAKVAKTLNEHGLRGKKGGKWTSTSVLRTLRNELHSTRNDDEAPRWFKKRAGSTMKQ